MLQHDPVNAAHTVSVMGDRMRSHVPAYVCIALAAIASTAFLSTPQPATETARALDTSTLPFDAIPQEYIPAAHPEKILYVPLVRQGRDYTCGVACVQSLLRYAGYEFGIREELLLEGLRVDASGTPIAGMVDFLNNARRSGENSAVARATVRENMTMPELMQSIDSGSPVICLIQAWQTNASGEYELRYDYSRVWSSGHYAVAIGYDAERIYFMDPSTTGTYTFIPRAELDARWHGAGEMTPDGIQRLEHTGIVVTIPNPRYTPHGFYKIL